MEEKKYVGKKELWMFALGAGGQGMIYAMMSSYISDYYINVLALSPIFVLLLMLLARVWDAINDPLMGMIVDSHTTKWGKMKPYILFASAPIAVLTILMYVNPGFSGTSLMVYCTLVYVLWGMTYTMADVPFWGIPNVITPDSRERGSVISFTKIINSVGSALPVVFFVIAGYVLPVVKKDISGKELEAQKYLFTAVPLVIVGIALYLNSYFHINERVVPPIKKRQKGEASALKRVFSCKPLMLVLVMGVLSSGRYMIGAAAIHVARYAFYIGPDLSTLDEAARTAAISSSVSSVQLIFNVCSAVGMFGATLLMPYLIKKVDYKKLLIYTCLAGAVSCVVTTIVGWYGADWFHISSGLYICIPFIIISCVPLGVINVITGALICDCLDYLELQTGYRDNGLGSAIQGFVNKIGNALSTSGIIVMYMILNINLADIYSDSEHLSIAATDLTSMQNFGVFSLISIVPGVSLILCAIPMFFYKISGKEKEKMLAELEAARAAKAEAAE